MSLIMVLFGVAQYANIQDATYDIIDKSYGKGCKDEGEKIKTQLALKGHSHTTDDILYEGKTLTEKINEILSKLE